MVNTVLWDISHNRNMVTLCDYRVLATHNSCVFKLYIKETLFCFNYHQSFTLIMCWGSTSYPWWSWVMATPSYISRWKPKYNCLVLLKITKKYKCTEDIEKNNDIMSYAGTWLWCCVNIVEKVGKTFSNSVVLSWKNRWKLITICAQFN